jgi:hypothetical protein
VLTVDPEPRAKRNPFVAAVLTVVLGLIAAMWVYAFFFAPREGVNRIEDRAWSERAETVCATAKAQLVGLADFRRISDVGPDALVERADIVAQANAILATMVDELAAVQPSGEKSQTIIPRWLDDYRTYLADRTAYVEQLRAGDGSGFAETEINGSPISNFLGDVARQNEMPSCQAPLDLAT